MTTNCCHQDSKSIQFNTILQDSSKVVGCLRNSKYDYLQSNGNVKKNDVDNYALAHDISAIRSRKSFYQTNKR